MTVILAIESSCDETGVGIAELGADGSVTFALVRAAQTVADLLAESGAAESEALTDLI